MDQSVYVSVRTVLVLGTLGWINKQQVHIQATCKKLQYMHNTLLGKKIDTDSTG